MYNINGVFHFEAALKHTLFNNKKIKESLKT